MSWKMLSCPENLETIKTEMCSFQKKKNQSESSVIFQDNFIFTGHLTIFPDCPWMENVSIIMVVPSLKAHMHIQVNNVSFELTICRHLCRMQHNKVNCTKTVQHVQQIQMDMIGCSLQEWKTQGKKRSNASHSSNTVWLNTVTVIVYSVFVWFSWLKNSIPFGFITIIFCRWFFFLLSTTIPFQTIRFTSNSFRLYCLQTTFPFLTWTLPPFSRQQKYCRVQIGGMCNALSKQAEDRHCSAVFDTTSTDTTSLRSTVEVRPVQVRWTGQWEVPLTFCMFGKYSFLM